MSLCSYQRSGWRYNVGSIRLYVKTRERADPLVRECALLSNAPESFSGSPIHCGPHPIKFFGSSWEQIFTFVFSSADSETNFSPYQQMLDHLGVCGFRG